MCGTSTESERKRNAHLQMTFSVDRSKTKSINGSDDDKSTSLFSFGDTRLGGGCAIVSYYYMKSEREIEIERERKRVVVHTMLRFYNVIIC